MKIAILMRGYAGGGKSYKAEQLAKEYDAVLCSADDYWIKSGKYVFDPSKLGAAHQECYDKFVTAIRKGKNVIIDNTNLDARSVEKYLDFISKNKSKEYAVCVYSVNHNDLATAISHRSNRDDGKNIPEDRIKAMYNSYHSVDLEKIAKEHYTDIKFVKPSEINELLA